jgi:glyoxylase-like metal-dependent hydrolase (beta-lactamase superfamily II)
MFVHQFQLGPWDNFIYFIGDEKTRRAAVVDPAWDVDTITRELSKTDVKLSAILCTHSHFDHVDQVEPLLKRFDVPVHMLREEVEFSGFRSENLVQSRSGERIRIGDTEITMIHTPGHTPGSVSYRVRDALVCGDTLFVNGCGRCDFVGGDPKVMWKTLQMLGETLPADTRIYPGHNYGPTPSATIADQKSKNPYYQHKTLDAFIKHRMEGKTPNSPLPPRPDWSAPRL